MRRIQHQVSISVGREEAVRIALVWVVTLVAALVATHSARAQTMTVLHVFTKLPDGQVPLAALVRDAVGNLYGTTGQGGSHSNGTVFKLDKTGREIVLHSFAGTGGDGAGPSGHLIRDGAGNLYGTTTGGGSHSSGTVFKLDKTGKEVVLYSFAGGSDGATPFAGVSVIVQGTSTALRCKAALTPTEPCLS